LPSEHKTEPKPDNSRSKDELKEDIDLALYDFNIFKSVALDLVRLYESGRARMTFVGPSFIIRTGDNEVNIMAEKKSVTPEVIRQTLSHIGMTMHFAIRKESKELCDRLKKAGENGAARGLLKKVNFIEGVLSKHPTIRSNFYAYSIGAMPFFDDINWVAGVRVFHAGSRFVEEDTPNVPTGSVRITVFELTGGRPHLAEHRTLEFDITLNDLRVLTRSLEDLRKALTNLETVRITK